MTFIPPSIGAAAVGITVWVAIGLGYAAAVVSLVRQGRAPGPPDSAMGTGTTDASVQPPARRPRSAGDPSLDAVGGPSSSLSSR